MNRIVLVLVLALVIAGCASQQTELSTRAKITRTEAEAIALKKAPGGKVKEAELEEEHGRLVWSFDIARPGTRNITEVLIDAITGRVVTTEIETPGREAQETAEQKTKS